MENSTKELTAYYTEDGFTLQWQPPDGKTAYSNHSFYEAYLQNSNAALFDFGFLESSSDMPSSLAFIHSVAERFIQSVSENPAIEFTRKAAPLSDRDAFAFLRETPYAVGAEYVNIQWIKSLWNRLAAEFETEIENFGGSVADFLLSRRPSLHAYGRVFFHLVESKAEDYPFAFLATYCTNADGGKKVSHMPLKNALLEYKEQSGALLKLLAAVSKAADKSDFISELVESGELFSPLRFSADEAYLFLTETPLYEECGILCRIPDWWKKQSQAVKLKISMGDRAPAIVGMDALLSFNPELYFGEEKITRQEMEELLAQTSGLSFIKNKWVEVDREKLQAALDAYDEAMRLARSEDLTLAEAMRMQLQPEQFNVSAPEDKVTVEISNGAWLETLKSRLLRPEDIEALDAGEEFKASLRHYQQTGFGWLIAMESLKFGALLADDMGLGKTVQILAFLEKMRQRPGFQALLIIPASLIGNWEKEIMKFAPKLSYRILHGAAADIDLAAATLYITTYGMALRLEKIKERKWSAVILDEAQAIKNAGTKQTKAVKQIPSDYRIAMTGTPIENKVSDLWSIFDFLNQGLLGTSKEFSDFSKTLHDQGNYARLREVVSPFILRRLKTDKRIISDLPDKIEIKDYPLLTKKQTALYAALVKELEKSLAQMEGIQRKGMVLASIIKFKQICNHPDQYLGRLEYDSKVSGKFEKLAEICETIREKRERVLVFTQFKEITEPLAVFLESLFGFAGLTLHGGTQVKKRAVLVEKFQGDEYVPFMILSLKAGGVGLNLTRANHVIHFDRWWNPAIENQATDRAFRIGQNKNVMVHKMITMGTIEEKIDTMIENKQKMAGDIIAGSGENWITEMNNEQLLDLFRLT
ncbi:MAG: DEAD/DEAH box helicase [Clostridiales bacterium]|nr:DEAD/DEAH box helicase [Clostridiales bacterium]